MVTLLDESSNLVGTYDTIQEAVNAAADGYTIVADGGVYVEQVAVNHIDDLTIRAADGESVTIQAPAGPLAITSTGPGGQAVYAMVTANSSLNFTLEGITVDGAGHGDHAWSPAGAAYDGVYFRNSSGSLLDVDIVGVRDPYRTDGLTADGNPVVDGVQHGYGVEVRNDTVLPFTMTGGSISDFQKNGGYFVRADLDITGVTVTGGGAQTTIAQNGFSIYYSTGNVSGNTIEGIGYAGPYESYSGGINAGSNVGLDITGNTIVGSNGESSAARIVGIWVFQTGGQPLSGGEVSGNTISWTDIGINASGPFSPNAILIEQNSVVDLDLTDPYVFGVNFQPTASLLIPFSAQGSEAGDLLAGALANDSLYGLAGNDQLTGRAGDDALDGGLGADKMTGGTGNDTYYVDDGADQVVEDADAGTDEVRTTLADYALGASLEDLTGLAVSGQTLTGNALANVIEGGDGSDALWGWDGDDTLDGGLGADTLDGGNGKDSLTGGTGDVLAGGADDDTYHVDEAGVTVTEASGDGSDRVHSHVSYALTDNVEELRLMGTGAIDGTGNGMANTIGGNDAANMLDGGAGADTLTGGKGDDTYAVDIAGDVVVEQVGEGTDLIKSAFSYILGSNLENLTLTGTNGIKGEGNGLGNVITGNDGSNALDGKGGFDTLYGGAGNDTLKGGAGDLLMGESGNDEYFIYDAGATVSETGGSGTDRVLSYVSYTIVDEVENLRLMGIEAIDGTGNAVANNIGGNDGANLLDGGAGADKLQGGKGNDTFIVDNAGDKVVENGGEGTDLVRTSINYVLAANVEDLTLTGTSAINGTGNAGANIITGNEAANTLDGKAGLDTLYGGGGNDVLKGGAGDLLMGETGNDDYHVSDNGVTVTEAAGEGTDGVLAYVSYVLADHVENLKLIGPSAFNGTGNADANVISGNEAANVLSGGGGNDVLTGGHGEDSLHGGLGTDTLTGGAGADRFYFDTGLSDDNVDKISGFSVADDTIFLNRTVFTEIGSDGTLAADAFRLGKAALDGDDRILYDKASGQIFYDADGNGAEAAVLFAAVNPGSVLTNLDFSAYVV